MAVHRLRVRRGLDGDRLQVRAVGETGERHFVRDLGLLESALARPRNFFAFDEEDVVVLAVALMAGIARAHAFEQIGDWKKI